MNTPEPHIVEIAEAFVHDTYQYTQTMKQIGSISLTGMAVSGGSVAMEALSREPTSALDYHLPESSLESIGLFVGAGLILAAAGAAIYEKMKHQKRFANN